LKLSDPITLVKKEILEKLPKELALTIDDFEIPPSDNFGDISLPLHSVAKRLGKKPEELSQSVLKAVSDWGEYTQKVESVGGYLNFFLDTRSLARLTWHTIKSSPSSYGKTELPFERVIVEHTSANPIHPLHIGAARNAVYGDTVARVLQACGKSVQTRFYVDDTGRQTAIAALGFKLAGESLLKAKPDEYVGQLYVYSNALVRIHELKKELNTTKDEEEVARLRGELDDWLGVIYEQSQKSPELYDLLTKKFSEIEDPSSEVAKIIRLYEEGDAATVKLVRRMVELCLQGFVQTLRRANIFHDVFDYESELVWNGSVERILDEVRASRYAKYEGNALVFDIDRAASELGLKKILGIPENHKIPELPLTRSDGTTLYVTRDMAYSLKKLSDADTVYNVIGVEQSLAQLQLKIALFALGYKKILNQHHLAYELVELPGYRMSGRRGRYVTFDSILDEAKLRAEEEVSKRNPELKPEERAEIAEKIAVAAVRFALTSVGATKKIIFSWDRVLDFEKNSGPYALYTYARANNIIRKAAVNPFLLEPEFSKLESQTEHKIVFACSRLPEVIRATAKNIKPEILTEYTLRLCDLFNSYYASTPVLGAHDEDTKNARLALVTMVRTCLGFAFGVLGVEALERM